MQANRNNKFLYLLLVMCALTSQCHAQISALPTRFVFKIDRPATQELTLMNRTNTPARALIEVATATNQLTEHYMGDWVVVYPPVISIPPQQRRTIRFTVRPPAEIAEGEYRAMILIKNQPQVLSAKQQDGEQDSISVGIPISLTLGLSLYGQSGKLVHQGNIDKVSVEKDDNNLVIKGILTNQGNAHLRIEASAQLLDNKGNKVKESSFKLVAQRSEEKAFEHKIQLEKMIDSGEIELIFKHDNKIISQSRTKL